MAFTEIFRNLKHEIGSFNLTILSSILIPISILTILCIPVCGQDLGAPDSLKMVFVTAPVNGTNVPVIVECSIYVDVNELSTLQYAWTWDNSNLRMDSAKASAEFNAMEIGPFFFLDNSIATTNDSQVAGASASAIVSNYSPSLSWKRLATFYMTMGTWDSSSTLLIDTVQLPGIAQTDYVFIPVGGSEYDPIWVGPLSPCGTIDTDNDGVEDCSDNCVFDYNPTQADSDLDGKGDVCDICPFDPLNDLDNDGICGTIDNCPNIYNPNQTDLDNDGVGDSCDLCQGFNDNLDQDTDGIPDSCDICEGYDDNSDSDNDGIPDGCDICSGFDDSVDNDGDGVPDGCDICSGFDDSVDTDGDGVPDGCDICPGYDDSADSDGDSVADSCDNCSSIFNTSQSDFDGDGIGDVCDACPFDPSNDTDVDGICGSIDNCPDEYNPDQMDSDSDGVGDSCDNCLNTSNPTQADTDNDGIGDACCCSGNLGDVNNDGNDANILDLTYLVDYIFRGGSTADCPNEADLNSDSGSGNILDLTYLVDFIFRGGPVPPACP